MSAIRTEDAPASVAGGAPLLHGGADLAADLATIGARADFSTVRAARKAADPAVAAAFRLIERWEQETISRGEALTSAAHSERMFRRRLRDLEHEVFAVAFLDNRHRVIAVEEMFRGSIDSTRVHPREVVKRALALNAAAVMVAHNHPCGVAEPSNADRAITHKLKGALELVDMRLLDHIVIGERDYVSFVERGWL
ncbi:MAG: DNA repair protein RadC [Thiotrichales bacterium]|nr:DNA repair protein RadC [Thiotrichales bacterium]